MGDGTHSLLESLGVEGEEGVMVVRGQAGGFCLAMYQEPAFPLGLMKKLTLRSSLCGSGVSKSSKW